jgi:large subunit ribosomal protein L21
LRFGAITISGEFFREGGVLMYAIIETGGKQYKVSSGDVIFVEKLNVSEGENYVFENVLAVSTDGGDISFGAPYVSGASVSAKVIENGREKKVIVYKYKPKKHFHKKKGHRQPFTKLEISSVEA